MRHRVWEIIRNALSEGRFQGGQSLSEVGLAAEMGISRGPVREALFLLAQEGLVKHSPNRGFSVIQFTENDHREIHVVRGPLEVMALNLARPRATCEDIQKLEELKRQMIHAYAGKEWRVCCESDMLFHSQIWERSGNSRLLSLLQHLMAPYFAYGAVFAASRSDIAPELLDEQHTCLIEFLQGNGDRTAEDCVRFHLRKIHVNHWL